MLNFGKFHFGCREMGQGFSLKENTPSSPAVPWGVLSEPPLQSKAPQVLPRPCRGNSRHAWWSQAALIFNLRRACFPSVVQTPEVPRPLDLWIQNKAQPLQQEDRHTLGLTGTAPGSSHKGWDILPGL